MEPLIGMMAAAQSEEDSRLSGIAARCPSLVRRLQKFHFPSVAQPLAGLLTLPANDPAHVRLSALLHLAAMFCHGHRDPTLAQLREWINDILLKDAIGQREDPVEDVSVSNVVTWFGNARIFDAGWQENDYALQAFLVAVVRLREEWMRPVAHSVNALLRLSEAVAARAGIPRFTLSEGLPRQPLRIVQSTASAASRHVFFSISELRAMGIGSRALRPFKFEPDMVPALAKEIIGHTTLERHPLVFTEQGVLLALPTAVSAAIRRFMIESAAATGRLDALEALMRDYQFEEVRRLGRVGWDIRELNPVEEPAALEFIGRFDEGAYVHVVFLPDTLEPVLTEGLQSMEHIPEAVTEQLDKTAFEIAKRADYQRGMTLVVHGGSGRGFFVGFGDAPTQWERLVLRVSDFMMLSWDTEMDALRAWKLLDRENELLTKRDTYFVNANGFMNLYGYAENVNYALVPKEMTRGVVALATDYLTGIRLRLRSSVDHHAALFTKTPGYLPVQRHTTKSYFDQAEHLPIYVSPAHMASGELLACVETETRSWWVSCGEHPDNRRARSVIYQVWELVLNWLVRAAPVLEADLSALTPGPITVRLAPTDIDQFLDRPAERADKPVGPNVKIDNSEIHLACTSAYLRSFASERNTGDRLMVEALIDGAYALSGSTVDEGIRHSLVSQIVKDDQSRFFHTVPAKTAREMLFAALERDARRFVQPEDRAASWLDLARDAGWTAPPGAVPKESANTLLNDCVTLIWKRIRGRLRELHRRSVVERVVSNEYAISRDGATWSLTAQALLSLYNDQAEIIAAANEREGERAISALSSRVICEMAICESPLTEGRVCTTADLDYLLANLSVLLECASQSDALHYGLVSRGLVVEPNGTFTFDTTFRDTLHGPYIRSHGERGFRSAAADYGSAFKVHTGDVKPLNPEYEAAFVAEFGLTPTQLLQLAHDLADISLKEGRPFFCRQRGDVLGYLNKVGAADPERAYNAVTLKPRRRWDEAKPKNAQQRDWYPWRFNRRLSLTRRPIVQLDLGVDPAVVIAPALVDRSGEFFMSTYNGRLPGELFDSTAMLAWIGEAADAEGHAFNKTVANAYKAFGFDAREVNMSELGGTPEMGDVDAFAWDPKSGVVYATECKRLLFARTVAEVGERLQEYTSIAAPGDDRTPIQKHLDRMTFLRSALPAISKLTGIPADKVVLRSALVTDYLVPMQFSEDALKLIDLVTDLSLLESAVMARQPSQL